MTRTLILTRHAKSSWADPAQDDFDRPLNNRGRKAAQTLGDWLSDSGHRPDAVIVSGARRTVETWGGITKRLSEGPVMRSDPALYHAEPNTMLRVLQSAQDPVVMLIGHNPGIAAFARRLVDTPPDHASFADYPTGATTVIGFDTDDWRGIRWGAGRVLDFVIPRELD